MTCATWRCCRHLAVSKEAGNELGMAEQKDGGKPRPGADAFSLLTETTVELPILGTFYGLWPGSYCFMKCSFQLYMCLDVWLML